ncbi:MAG: zinc-ribbon domain-containing protein [Actinomycetota bacterium]
MPESVEAWWRRRRWSKGVDVPYAVGTYRADWERYPVLVRQYHPDLNAGVTLTQVPPAAEVYLQWQCDAGHVFVATPTEQRNRPGGGQRRRSTWCPECTVLATGRPARKTRPRVRRAIDSPTATAGEAFWSAKAPRPASAAEARLRQLLGERLAVDPHPNAVRVRNPFFERFEVWPDIVIEELRVAIEYDTVGSIGVEHVGPREDHDRRKDRLLRSAGWEVIRIRCGKLRPIGPYDLIAAGVSAALADRVLDRLGEIRGELIVRSFARAGTE